MIRCAGRAKSRIQVSVFAINIDEESNNVPSYLQIRAV
jgi:hypothetical protein